MGPVLNVFPIFREQLEVFVKFPGSRMLWNLLRTTVSHGKCEEWCVQVQGENAEQGQVSAHSRPLLEFWEAAGPSTDPPTERDDQSSLLSLPTGPAPFSPATSRAAE